MRLESLEIVNFRGIGRLNLDLEPGTTVLFGENAWGKTSLVEALSTVLGSRPLTEADFHRLQLGKTPIARRMVITLGFGGEPLTGLEEAGWRDDEGAFHVRLAITARRPSRGRMKVDRRFLGPEGRERKLPGIDASLLAERLLEAHPLHVFTELRLADWMLAPVASKGPEVRETPARAVRQVFERLLASPHQVHPDELARGLEALHQLAETRPDLFHALPTAGQGVRRAKDMADAPVDFADQFTLSELAHKAGAGMRQVALLALIGAMLKAEAESPRSVGAQPILLFEDPETHLHPIQLATAWSLIAQLPGQKLVATSSSELLASQSLRSLRRLVRRPDHVEVFPRENRPLSASDARRVAFHVRTHRAQALFARVWLLVEGETEAWLLPELARIAGLSFPLEGIACVEFAQAGLSPLIRFADDFGIPWHVLADGDDAGRGYVAKATARLYGRKASRHITGLPARDVEHLLWHHGYASLFRHEAEPGLTDPTAIIKQALHRVSKPGMALALAEAAGQRGPEGVPAALRKLFITLRSLAQKG